MKNEWKFGASLLVDSGKLWTLKVVDSGTNVVDLEYSMWKLVIMSHIYIITYMSHICPIYAPPKYVPPICPTYVPLYVPLVESICPTCGTSMSHLCPTCGTSKILPFHQIQLFQAVFHIFLLLYMYKNNNNNN